MPLKLQRCARSSVRRNARWESKPNADLLLPLEVVTLHYGEDLREKKEGLTDSKAVKKDPNGTEPINFVFSMQIGI